MREGKQHEKSLMNNIFVQNSLSFFGMSSLQIRNELNYYKKYHPGSVLLLGTKSPAISLEIILRQKNFDQFVKILFLNTNSKTHTPAIL